MNPSMHDGTAEQISKELGEFESPLDGSRQRLVTPQDLAGPKYKDLHIILGASTKPILAKKVFAYATEPYQERMEMKLSE